MGSLRVVVAVGEAPWRNYHGRDARFACQALCSPFEYDEDVVEQVVILSSFTHLHRHAMCFTSHEALEGVRTRLGGLWNL